MSAFSPILGKISDRLENRDKQTNFGICKGCGKKVYWSSSKVASHIRSGHCSGATEDEVQFFKKEFVYDSPKNLVHKSAITKKFKENFEIEEYSIVKESPKYYTKKPTKSEGSPESKRAKIEVIDEYHDEIDFEEEEFSRNELDQNDQNKVEIVILNHDNQDEIHRKQSSSSGQSREERFIHEVYPQFKGQTKLELIDQILDLTRRYELLQAKAKTYENTINRLLN